MLPNAPYHHVAVATGTRHVHVAGQVAYTDDGVRLTMYVTDWDPMKIEELVAGVEAVAQEIDLPTPMPPAALIGVAILYEPGVLVEIEATAILD